MMERLTPTSSDESFEELFANDLRNLNINQPQKNFRNYRFTKQSDDWRQASCSELPIPQKDLEKRARKGKSKSGTAIEQLERMKENRRNHIIDRVHALNADEEGPYHWEPVWIEIDDLDYFRKSRKVRAFRVIFQRKAERAAPLVTEDRRSSRFPEILQAHRSNPKNTRRDYRDDLFEQANTSGGSSPQSSTSPVAEYFREDPYQTKPMFSSDGRPMDVYGSMPFESAGNPPHVPQEQPMGRPLPKQRQQAFQEGELHSQEDSEGEGVVDLTDLAEAHGQDGRRAPNRKQKGPIRVEDDDEQDEHDGHGRGHGQGHGNRQFKDKKSQSRSFSRHKPHGQSSKSGFVKANGKKYHRDRSSTASTTSEPSVEYSFQDGDTSASSCTDIEDEHDAKDVCRPSPSYHRARPRSHERRSASPSPQHPLHRRNSQRQHSPTRQYSSRQQKPRKSSFGSYGQPKIHRPGPPHMIDVADQRPVFYQHPTEGNLRTVERRPSTKRWATTGVFQGTYNHGPTQRAVVNLRSYQQANHQPGYPQVFDEEDDQRPIIHQIPRFEAVPNIVVPVAHQPPLFESRSPDSNSAYPYEMNRRQAEAERHMREQGLRDREIEVARREHLVNQREWTTNATVAATVQNQHRLNPIQPPNVNTSGPAYNPNNLDHPDHGYDHVYGYNGATAAGRPHPQHPHPHPHQQQQGQGQGHYTHEPRHSQRYRNNSQFVYGN